MKTLTEQLTTYATYHRDRRNIATHFVGIPLILLAICALLVGLSTWVAGLAVLAATVFYFRLDVRFGLAMLSVMIIALEGGRQLAALPTALWLGLSLGAFVVGWAFQFLGHAFEGRKPAFVDDLIGLLVGPLFIVAEVAFALGLRRELREEIERQAGPTLIRPRGVAASR